VPGACPPNARHHGEGKDRNDRIGNYSHRWLAFRFPARLSKDNAESGGHQPKKKERANLSFFMKFESG